MFLVQIDTGSSSVGGTEGDFNMFLICVEAVSPGGATTLQAAVTATISIDMSGKGGLFFIT